MKTLKSLVIVKSIAVAAFVAAGLAAPTVSHASPNDGVHCRTGYTGTLVNGNFICSKFINHTGTNGVRADACPAAFPTKVIRAGGLSGDSTNGRDVCLAPNRSLSSNDLLTGLVENQDFRFVSFATRTAAVRAADEINERNALGLAADQVDRATASATLKVNAGTGGEDLTDVVIKLDTFAVQ